MYRAEHILLKRPCAIKFIAPKDVAEPEALKLFEREVKATARLSHWNTVEVYDYFWAALSGLILLGCYVLASFGLRYTPW